MKKLFVMAALLGLSACARQDDTQTQMQQAIENAAQFNQVCLPYALNIEHKSPHDQATYSQIGAPQIKLLKRQENGKRANSQAVKQMGYLVDAGLYQAEKEEKMGEGDHAPRYLVYSLTEQGKEHIRLGHHSALLCVGTAKVEKIDYFTEPTPNRGYTVSQVHYTAKIVPEKWAKSLLKENDALKNMEKIERNATLVKTNDGWRDIRQLH